LPSFKLTGVASIALAAKMRQRVPLPKAEVPGKEKEIDNPFIFNDLKAIF
jgi:hypothetical protein